MIYIEIESTGKILPLPKNERLRVTFQAADFGDAGSTSGSFSTTISLPMTSEVMEALGFSNVLNVTSQLSPYKNIKARLLQDNNEIDKGFIRIDEDDSKSREIQVTFLGRNVDWFTSLGDKTLRELDFSEYNHVKNNTTINEERTDGYVYLPIDNGALTTKSTATITSGQIFPAIFVNTVVKKIFKDAGYKVTGSLFEKQDFNRLILPFTLSSPFNSDEFINRYKAVVERKNLPANILTTYQSRVKLQFDNDNYSITKYDVQIQDIADSWSLTNFRYTAQTPLYIRVTFNSGGLVAYDTTLPSGSNEIRPATIILGKNGTDVQTQTFKGMHVFNEIFLAEGDYLELFLTFTQTWNYFDYKQTSAIFSPTTKVASLVMSDYLPNLKQSELMEYLFFIFGVIPSFDKATSSVVLDTVSDLTIGTAVDWGDKIDGLQPIEKMYFDFVDNYAKKNICTYEINEDDTLLKAYLDEHKENYGNGFFKVDNDYIEAEQNYYDAPLISTISQRVFTGISGLDFYLPYILRSDTATARILYFAGFQSVSDLTQGDLASITIDSTARTTIPYSYFINPIAQPLNDPINIRHLGFSDPKDESVQGKSILATTYGNLQRILNKPISITVSLRLTAFDIANLKYNKLKYFEQLGGYYYLNKVGQYDGSGESTECELIKWY